MTDEYKIGFVVFALILFAAIFWRLRIMSNTETCPFDIRDLVLSDGKASKSAVILMGAFLLTSLYFIYAVLSDKMTDTLFLAYTGVWVVPALTKTVKG